MPGIGRPTGTSSSTVDDAVWKVEIIVASVGPYWLTRRTPGASPRAAATCADVSGSPLTSTTRRSGRVVAVPAAVVSIRSVVGTRDSSAVAECSRAAASIAYGSRIAPSGSSTTVAPAVSGPSRSRTEASKVTAATWSTVSPAVTSR